ncbi:nucleoside-diphosphate sugar epimerase [Shewanella sp. Choline-02u-19]|uniref:nucleoside-diphosphate sugar epimerase n=1 Tax=unclassified Shewanella TaxID=196818 RepID=UPI000C34AB8A|nr:MULTISPECIES: nucleoside-diphosphate sugar epimerase [unclassified Shewanella]PKH54882.1 nucleoside-diphosphate sugar epimerase [Shewanella sp. Bg11-22]PKI26654.1 nucleoside-diphosphate sugar epimerase [Shewanella sp. Choline-02u-19]
MNAAIIGATGLIGRLLLQKLIDSAAYNKILVFGRREATFAASLATEVIFISCQLSQLPTVTVGEKIDHAFCCLGTTIKQAGSQQAFIAVDKTAVIDFVQLCHGSTNLVVTALGADAQSSTFYNRIKGETELALASTLATNEQAKGAIAKLILFQPSLLLGERSQHRPLESLGQSVFNLVSPLFIGPLKRYQPISANSVASAMLTMALNPKKLYPVNSTNSTMAERQVIRVHNETML